MKLRVINGSLLIIGILLLMTRVIDARDAITIKICDTKGRSCAQVIVGRPWMLEVEVPYVQGHQVEYPTIKGSPEVTLKKSGFQFTTINGKSHATYRLEGRIDTPGTYCIGPAEAPDNVSSGILSLNVVDRPLKEKRKKIFAQCLVDKNEVRVHEQLICRVRLYSQATLPSITQVLLPLALQQEIQKQKQKVEPLKGDEVIDGINYRYIEWKFIVYPSIAKTLIIEPSEIEYEVAPKRASRIGFFFFPTKKTKRVYTDACTVVVRPLPAGVTTTHVGSYLEYSSSIDHSSLKEGDTATYTLTLKSDIDLSAINTLSLAHIPQAIKWYPGQVNYQYGNNVKQWEYVLHAVSSGSWEIPAQKYSYFNTLKNEYMTVYTAPIKVTVEAQPTTAASASHKIEPSLPLPKDNQINSKHVSSYQEKYLKPINETGPWTPYMTKVIPWTIVLGIILVTAIGAVWAQWLLQRRTQRKYRLATTYASLNNLLNTKRSAYNASVIYNALLTFAAAYYECSKSQITYELLVQLGSKVPNESVQNDWKYVINSLYHAAYGKNDHLPSDFYNHCARTIAQIRRFLQ